MANTTDVAIANLYTTEKYFDHFVVEMHTDNTGANRVGIIEIKGAWDVANSRFAQQRPQYFQNATVGTTYYFRSAVADSFGNMSAWSVWLNIAAGSNTAPSNAYSPTATITAAGIRIASNPTSPSAVVNHYEFYWKTANTAPSGSSLPNLPNSIDGTALVHMTIGETAWFWIRAVDTFGNKQTWTALGSFANGSHDQIADGSTYGGIKLTALTGGAVDLTKAGVLMKGSLQPSFNAAFSYTSTTTSITWSWTGLSVFRADGTVTAITNGSQAITGLAANTAYNFYPYWDDLASTLLWVTSAAVTSAPNLQGVLFARTATPAGYVSTTTQLASSPTTYSVECWLKTTNTASGSILTQLAANQTGVFGTNFINLTIGLTGVIGITHGANAIQLAAGAYNDGLWHHVIVSTTASSAIIYVDGVVAMSSTALGAPGAGTCFWRLADESTNSGLTEIVSMVAVYSAALSAAQAAAHYNAMTSTGMTAFATAVLAEASIIYFWKLLETSGTSAADSKGTNTGTYQGGAQITLNQTSTLAPVLGSPVIAWVSNNAYASQLQHLQSNIPLSGGGMAGSTTVSGTGGGSGGGSGGGAGGGGKRVL